MFHILFYKLKRFLFMLYNTIKYILKLYKYSKKKRNFKPWRINIPIILTIRVYKQYIGFVNCFCVCLFAGLMSLAHWYCTDMICVPYLPRPYLDSSSLKRTARDSCTKQTIIQLPIDPNNWTWIQMVLVSFHLQSELNAGFVPTWKETEDPVRSSLSRRSEKWTKDKQSEECEEKYLCFDTFSDVKGRI